MKGLNNRALFEIPEILAGLLNELVDGQAGDADSAASATRFAQTK